MNVSIDTAGMGVHNIRDALEDLEQELEDYDLIVDDDGMEYEDALDAIQHTLDGIRRDMDEIGIWLRQEYRAAFMLGATIIIKKPGAGTPGEHHSVEEQKGEVL